MSGGGAMETLWFLFICYLRLSLTCSFIMLIVFKYDTTRYPTCLECGDNLLTQRPWMLHHNGFLDPLAKCQIHGWFKA